MTDLANAFLLVYAGLFPILNPIGSAPIFFGLTSACTEGERNAHLLVFFGITLPVVRIAGGLVLIAFGWKLLHNGAELEDKRSSEAGSHSTAIDSFYPLTMPLTVGPGSISVAIALGSQRPEGPLTLSQLALLGGSAIAGIIALSLTVYVCYRFAKRTIALLGGNGINVVIRLSAFILLCIGIQVLWTGYSALVIAPRA
jgi:multiple antibiotic resistance protein